MHTRALKQDLYGVFVSGGY